MPSKIDLTGHTYGRWSVLNEVTPTGKNKLWLCQCVCGTLKKVAGGSLRAGTSTSCGCFKNEVQRERLLKHGDATSNKKSVRLYRIWTGMKARCFNPNTEFYSMYGGKGISVCSEWLDYNQFKQWALCNGYSDKLTLDRKNSNENYSSQNCRWVTFTIQARNQTKYKNNSSGYTGVVFHPKTKKWRATLTINKKTISLGLHTSKEAAATARTTYIKSNNLKGFNYA